MIAAITRSSIADYVQILVWIYTILILIRILLTWVEMAWTMPENQLLRGFLGFVDDVTEPYLALWRKIIPPIRSGAGYIDLSPVIAIFALMLIGNVAAALIR